jgi:hypothetical protein
MTEQEYVLLPMDPATHGPLTCAACYRIDTQRDGWMQHEPVPLTPELEIVLALEGYPVRRYDDDR